MIKDVAPYIAIGAQILLFFNIDNNEVRVALLIVLAFQFWQKSRRSASSKKDKDNNGGEEEHRRSKKNKTTD